MRPSVGTMFVRSGDISKTYVSMMTNKKRKDEKSARRGVYQRRNEDEPNVEGSEWVPTAMTRDEIGNCEANKSTAQRTYRI